ncbi:MAG: hypothetical protein JNJ71_17560 [Rubrivivax sp.]|nr:hypothetical protein [Rubrivivax sp.]
MGLFSSEPIIANRAEFAEALHRMLRGHVLVRTGDSAHGCVIDGAPVYHSFDVLSSYGLIHRFHNPAGFPGVEYYRLSDAGRQFADRIWRTWRSRRTLERLVVRFTG